MNFPANRLDCLAMPMAYLFLVAALFIKNGYYHPLALFLLLSGIALSYYYYFRFLTNPVLPEERGNRVFSPRLITSQSLPMALGTKTRPVMVVVLCLFALTIKRYHLSSMHSPFLRTIVLFLFLAEALLIIRHQKRSLYALCGLVFCHNLVYSLSCGIPPIDVYHCISEGARCIINLHNPYTHIYPQIYAPDDAQFLYGSQVSTVNGIPFQPYLPLALILSIPGVILGDIRVITIAAFAAIPMIIHGIARAINLDLSDSQKRLLCAIPLFFPVQAHLLFQAWNDALPAVFFVLFIYFSFRKRGFLSYASLAIMIGLKQYSAFFALPMLFLINFKDYKFYAAMFLFLFVPIAVFAVADHEALLRGIALCHLGLPFRPESLSIISGAYNIFHFKIADTTAYFAAIVLANAAAVFYCWKKKSDISAMAFSSYILFSLFLLLSKQSFLNYYFVLSVMLFCSLILTSISPFPKTSSPCPGH